MVESKQVKGRAKDRDVLAERLGHNIMRFRKALGLTQDQLAHQLDVEPETISRFERGATMPSLATLARIAKVLRATIAELLDEKSPPAHSNTEKLSALLEPLSKQDQKFVLSMCAQLSAHCIKRRAAKSA